MRYWLMKTEPGTFSLDDLRRGPGGVAPWDGVRNYQSRNTMRDGMKLGDRVLIYHSGQKELAIVGVASVAREAYPDHTAWDPAGDHFDPRSTPEHPVWLMVDVRFESAFPRPLSLPELRAVPELKNMVLLRRGMRLSVQPVTEAEFQAIEALAQEPAPPGADPMSATSRPARKASSPRSTKRKRKAPASPRPGKRRATGSAPKRRR
jgi:predicted RNA-binding protein with PUA-like domain